MGRVGPVVASRGTETESERAKREEEKGRGKVRLSIMSEGDWVTANVLLLLLFCLGSLGPELHHTRSTFAFFAPVPATSDARPLVIETASPSIWTGRE